MNAPVFRRFFRSIRKLFRIPFYKTITPLQDYTYTFLTNKYLGLVHFFNSYNENMINPNKGKLQRIA